MPVVLVLTAGLCPVLESRPWSADVTCSWFSNRSLVVPCRRGCTPVESSCSLSAGAGVRNQAGRVAAWGTRRDRRHTLPGCREQDILDLRTQLEFISVRSTDSKCKLSGVCEDLTSLLVWWRGSGNVRLSLIGSGWHGGCTISWLTSVSRLRGHGLVWRVLTGRDGGLLRVLCVYDCMRCCRHYSCKGGINKQL